MDLSLLLILCAWCVCVCVCMHVCTHMGPCVLLAEDYGNEENYQQ